MPLQEGGGGRVVWAMLYCICWFQCAGGREFIVVRIAAVRERERERQREYVNVASAVS